MKTIPLISILLILLAFTSPNSLISKYEKPISTFEFEFNDPGSFFENKVIAPLFQMTSDRVYIDGDDQLNIFDLEGTQIGSYPLPEGFWIANFTPIPHLGVIAINALAKREGGFTKRMFFTDDDGAHRGVGYDPSLADPISVNFRQVIRTENDRLIVNAIHANDLDGSRTRLLQEIELYPVDGSDYAFYGESAEPGYEIIYRGEPFNHRRYGAESLGAAFQQEFLAQMEHDERVFVVEQLQRTLGVFESEHERFRSVGSHNLNLGREVTPSFIQKSLNNEDWYHSFTRVTGLFGLKNGFVIAYENPNPKHETYADEFGEVADPDAHSSVLLLQRLDHRGKPIGPLREIPGAFVLGVSSNRIYTIHTSEDQNPRAEIRSLDFLQPN
jgi:hypothetical protein